MPATSTSGDWRKLSHASKASLEFFSKTPHQRGTQSDAYGPGAKEYSYTASGSSKRLFLCKKGSDDVLSMLYISNFDLRKMRSRQRFSESSHMTS